MKRTQVTLDAEGQKVRAYCLFPYEDRTVKALLYALKRKASRELLVFVSELYLSLLEDFTGEMCVVNVPRSKSNVKKYGYDHVEKPCRIMCKKKAGLTFAPVLKRTRTAEDQKNLTAAERRINVRGKFTAVKKDIPGNILLVDDVITTSSTMCECIRELQKAYPKAQITCISLASTSGASDFARK